MAPRVTVLTATYNRAGLLRETIDSVLRQTFPDFEYIVASDGSTDDTREVVESYHDDRILFLELPHRGQVATWETLFQMAGAEAAEGDLVAYLSDDDLWDPAFLERSVAALDARPDAVLAYADYRNLVDGKLVPSIEPRRCNLNASHLSFGCFISMCLAVVRRESLRTVYDRIGSFFDPIGSSACGDWTLFLNLSSLGPFVHICEPLGTIRLHREQDSVMTNVLELAWRRFLVRRKYANIPLLPATREAAELVLWGTVNRLKKRWRRWRS